MRSNWFFFCFNPRSSAQSPQSAFLFFLKIRVLFYKIRVHPLNPLNPRFYSFLKIRVPILFHPRS